MERQFGTRRKTLPPEPPPPTLTYATKMYDPLYGSPAAEGRQQLIVARLLLTRPRKHWAPPDSAPKEGILAGKRLLIKAQALVDGANGRRLEANQWFWPVRGPGAEDGSQNLSKLDMFLARVLGHIPRRGTFELSELIGVNFMATVVRRRQLIGGEYHPCAYFAISNPDDASRLYDGWPSYTPTYASQERIFDPPELEGVVL